MKVFVILFLAALAAAVGYLLGTESGNRRRDDLVRRVRRDSGSAADAVKDAGSEAADAVKDAGSEAADAVAEVGQQFNA